MKFVFFILALISVSANAATWNAASTSFTDVKAAIDSAADGDTVNIPAGTSTWGSTLTVTNGITINGAGINSTFLNNSQALNAGTEQPNFYISLHADKKLTFQHMHFKQTSGVNTAIGCFGTTPQTATMVRVTDCAFENFNFALMIRQIFGVVDHCTFTNNRVMYRNSGWYQTSFLGSNITDPRPWSWDSTNTFCFEDCTNSVDASVAYQYLGDTELPAAYTVRYCTFIIVRSGGNGYDGWDMHGNANFPSGINNVGIQIYGNRWTWSGSTTSLKLSDIRGGYGSLVYSNTITGNTAYNQVRADPPGSTAPQQTYFWENRDSTGNDIGASAGSGATLNVNYFLSKPAGFKQMVYPHPLVGSPPPPPPPTVFSIGASGSGITVSGAGITIH